MMKVVLVESTIGAGALKGHAEHYVNGFALAAKAVGANLTILTHRNGARVLEGGHACLPILSYSSHERLSRDGYDAKLEAFAIGRDRLAADLESVNSLISDAELFVLPTAISRELAGLALWLKAGDRRSRIAAIFHWGGSSGYSRGSIDAAILRQAARRIDEARPIATWFAATQPSLAQALAGPLGSQVRLASSLTFFHANSERSPGSSRVRIGIMGGARREKGAGLLCKLADLLGQNAGVELVIQCHGVDRSSLFSAELSRRANVTLLPEWLDEPSMLSMCASLDLAILPYDRWFYSQAISGVFTLLAGVGVPCIVPSGTWMSERISAGETDGVVYSGSSADEIVESVNFAIGHLQDLTKGSSDKSDRWRNRYSADGQVNEIINLINHSGLR